MDTIPVRLGNEASTSRDVYQCSVRWHGEWRKVLAQAQDSDETPLLGMELMRGSIITIEANESGIVQIEQTD